MRPGPTGPLLNLNISTEVVLTFLQLATVLLDLATEGEDDDEDVDQTVCAICLTFFTFVLLFRTKCIRSFSYCCACRVLDALARKAPTRIVWPLVKDFIGSKVAT